MGKFLVLQTDFGLKDGAVSAMYGVAYNVSDSIVVADLTHGITPFNIFEGSYRLSQTVRYWQPGTVFVSVVDPGVGSKRLSLAAKLKTGHYVITPDNGTLTHLSEEYGIEEVRAIDEIQNRLPGSENSATFHGRDIYAYNGARLAAGLVKFEDLGQTIPVDKIVKLPLSSPSISKNTISGALEITDVNFGSVWSNISRETWINDFGAKIGDVFKVKVFKNDELKSETVVPYVKTFADVKEGEPLIYINSVYTVGVAIRNGNFVSEKKVLFGPEWTIEFSKVKSK